MTSQLNRTAANAVLQGRVVEAVIGANRRIRRDGSVITGMLHGQHLVSADGNRLVIQAHHRTANCRMAIADFLALLGHHAAVSFAKGRLIVTIDGKIYATDGDRIEVNLGDKQIVQKDQSRLVG